jgi:hypothetical protein
MDDRHCRCALAVGLALALLPFIGCDLSLRAAPDASAVDKAFARFWDAPDTSAAAKAVKKVVDAGVSFDEAWTKLKRGRAYSKGVPMGRNQLKHRTSDGLEHNYTIVIPENYDASRQYQVRVQLHGGVSRESSDSERLGIDRIPGSTDQIYVHPVAWAQSKWWGGNQVENILGILDRLKRTYNVDENRVYLTGISDGGTGTYFMAFRETTPWASFLPLNGDMGVLADASVTTDGDMHPGNAVNKPFFIVNGGRDRLYPAAIVEPDINYLRKLGVKVAYHPQPDAGHDTSWWPTEKDNFEAFVREHPRDPLPDHLSWETELTERYNRAHWLVIDKLGSTEGQTAFPDTAYLFPERQPSGRVDLVRRGNTIEASTQGVKEFTLLLSPDAFDFNSQVKVVTNGRVAFEGKVVKSVATLLKWAGKDNDRTMLFGAELKIQVGKS